MPFRVGFSLKIGILSEYPDRAINNLCIYLYRNSKIYIVHRAIYIEVKEMASMKKCPYCKGMHRLKRQALKCKQRHKIETWRL